MIRLRGDDVRLSSFVKVSHALDGHVVGLGGSRREDDLLGVGADDGRDVRACLLDGVLGFPAVHVRAAVRVSVLLHEVGHHGVENPRVDRCGRLHVEVERAALECDALHLDLRAIGDLGRCLGGEPARVERARGRGERPVEHRGTRRGHGGTRHREGRGDGRGAGERAGAGGDRAAGSAREGTNRAHDAP